MDLAEHLFRQESGRLVAVLVRLFGVHNLALAEDVVQDVFCRALETWKYHGAPRNPSAWLMTAARNRAVDLLRREGTARRFAPELSRLVLSEWTLAPGVDEHFETAAIDDDRLRMIFSCIHPEIPEETQLALVLHLVCGFSIGETAAAFLKTGAAMEKRLGRAKGTLARSRQLFNLTGPEDVAAREPAVLSALYLLFNEGYHGASTQSAVRRELCDEALRLVGLLLDNSLTATPAAHALASLFQFLSARLPGRISPSGELTALIDQDRSSWDAARIAEGRRQLDLAASGTELTAYHLEAAIASLHASSGAVEETDWSEIVSLYDTLMTIRPSPVVALNRAVAVAQREGPTRGLEEIDRIDDRGRLVKYPFYFATLGDLELRAGNSISAAEHLRTALSLARNPEERRFLEERLRECAERSSPAPGRDR